MLQLPLVQAVNRTVGKNGETHMLKYSCYCIKRKTHVERILYMICHCLILQSDLLAILFLGILGFNIFIKNAN